MIEQPVWRKSSHSDTHGECVEVADLSAAVGIRDSKSPGSPALTISRAAWRTFAERVRTGAYEVND